MLAKMYPQHVEGTRLFVWRLFCAFNARTQLPERARSFLRARNFWMVEVHQKRPDSNQTPDTGNSQSEISEN